MLYTVLYTSLFMGTGKSDSEGKVRVKWKRTNCDANTNSSLGSEPKICDVRNEKSPEKFVHKN